MTVPNLQGRGGGVDVNALTNYLGNAAVPLSTTFRPTALGPYPASDLTSVVVDNNAPAYADMQYVTFNTPNRFRYGGAMTNNNGFGFNSINGADAGGFGLTGFDVECDVRSTQVAFMVQNYGREDFRIIVDDVDVTRHWQHFPSANLWFIKLTFADAGPHRIRLMLPTIGFAQALVPLGGLVYPAPPRYRVLFTGDSYGHGGESVAGTIRAGTLCGELAVRLGWEAWNLCQGGTGYTNPGAGSGSSVYGSADRLAAYAAVPVPDLIVVIGGANDGDYGQWPKAATLAAANKAWTDIAATVPGVPIVVWGVESGIYPGITASMNDLNAALGAAADAHPAVAGYVDCRSDPWFTGTGKEDAPTGDGNRDFAMGSDGFHPTHFGWGEIYAERGIRQLASILVPQPGRGV